MAVVPHADFVLLLPAVFVFVLNPEPAGAVEANWSRDKVATEVVKEAGGNAEDSAVLVLAEHHNLLGFTAPALDKLEYDIGAVCAVPWATVNNFYITDNWHQLTFQSTEFLLLKYQEHDSNGPGKEDRYYNDEAHVNHGCHGADF